MTLRSLLTFLSGYRGRRNWGFSYQPPARHARALGAKIKWAGRRLNDEQ